MLRFGPDTGPKVIAALPLFEEANRTRAAVVDVLRRLAARGIGGALPDLPGTGESLIGTRDATLRDWREAFAAATATSAGPIYTMSWRGGALVDGCAEVAGRWQLSPVDGPAAARELHRIRQLGNSDTYAGNIIDDEMIAELQNAVVSSRNARVVRLPNDPRPAEAHISGMPLWRASEPGIDPAMQEAIADDVARWIETCAG